jgi:hypothetical protein
MEVMELLTTENKEVTRFNNTYGEHQKSFGNGKLKLLELILASFKIQFNQPIFNQANLTILMVSIKIRVILY